jgi:hypothetical protein
MEDSEQLLWANITTLHIRNEIQNVMAAQQQQIITLKVDVILRNQSPPYGITLAPSLAPSDKESSNSTVDNRFSRLFSIPLLVVVVVVYCDEN